MTPFPNIHSRLAAIAAAAICIVSARSAEPAGELRAALEGDAAAAGLQYRYHEVTVETTLDLADHAPTREGRVPRVAFPDGIRRDFFGLEIWGAIDVPADGTYTFFTHSDDGSRLYIGDQLVVNNDYPHGPTEVSGAIALAKGRHPIQVTYFETIVGETLSVSWQGPGVEKAEIPAEVLTHHERLGVVPAGGIATRTLTWPDKPYRLTVVVDTRDAPDLAAFQTRLPELLQAHYPTMLSIVGDPDALPESVRFSFRPGLDIPAYAGRGIVMSADWFRERPNDLGCAIHELTHIVQRYPGFEGKPGWLVEGIADYVRHRVGLDDGWRIPNGYRNGHHYSQGYGVTTAFLVFAEKQSDPALVNKMDRALRNGTYTPELWATLTGKPLEQLWEAYKADR